MGNLFLELQKITLRLHILCKIVGNRELQLMIRGNSVSIFFIKTCNCLVNKIMQINEDPIY